MPITLLNRQHVIIDLNRTKKAAKEILKYVGAEKYDLHIELVSIPYIRQLKFERFNIPKATDVISLAPQSVRRGSLPLPLFGEYYILGEIYLCPRFVLNHRPELGYTIQERIERLLIHSVCHLLGYDHVTDEDYNEMFEKEMDVMKNIRRRRWKAITEYKENMKQLAKEAAAKERASKKLIGV
jgi:probable rRNA maturation factor